MSTRAVEARLIFLGGAPDCESLRWDDGALLEPTLISPVKRFLGDSYNVNQEDTTASSAQLLPSKWRRIVPANKWTTDILYEDDDSQSQESRTQFYSFQNQSGHDDESQDRLKFLEHSLAVLNELDSSQIVASPDATSFEDPTLASTIVRTDLSFSYLSDDNTTSMSMFNTSSSPTSLQPFRIPQPVTDISHIPPASHLTRIHPQTMTVNILAAIIALPPPRRVSLRRNQNIEMDIIELLLGDDTRAGFSVTFWLPASDSQERQRKGAIDADEQSLRATLRALRVGNVVCVSHVALSSWKGKVFGQSLRRRAGSGRVCTSIGVVAEEAISTSGAGDAIQWSSLVKAKTKRVRTWRDDFVGIAGVGPVSIGPMKKKKRKFGVDEEVLPPDTQ